MCITRLTKPAALAGGCAKRLVDAAKIIENKYRARAWQRFSNFFEKAFVNRVKPLMLIRMVSFGARPARLLKDPHPDTPPRGL
jgi:hypothetical protein